MDEKRRTFLKIAGVSLLGLGAKPVVNALADNEKPKLTPRPEALTGKRWAMVIDIKKCKENCTDCVDICHKIHNVPNFENPKDEVKWLWKESYKHAFPGQEYDYIKEYEDTALAGKKYLVLCNHCDNPPCVQVCPAKSTYRREDGIIMQNFRRCIGCKYCIAACPYGVRNYNYKDQEEKEYHRVDTPLDRTLIGPWPFPHRTHGVVEKCTFCYHRIEQGLKDGKVIGVDVVPACVEACPTKSRTFGDLDDPHSGVSQQLESRNSFRLRESMGTEPKVYYLSK